MPATLSVKALVFFNSMLKYNIKRPKGFVKAPPLFFYFIKKTCPGPGDWGLALRPGRPGKGPRGLKALFLSGAGRPGAPRKLGGISINMIRRELLDNI